jgi:hypothetical protein
MGESDSPGQTAAAADDEQPTPAPDEKAAAATEEAKTKAPPGPGFEDTPPAT